MRNSGKVGLLIAAAGVLGSPYLVRAQADYMPPLSGNILSIWQTQGEYYGSQTGDETKHLGAWLVANGGSNYGLVVLPGGLLDLPGQKYGGWDKKTRYQGASGPANGALNGKVYTVSTTTGGYVADSITGTGEDKSLYLHNGTAAFVLKRVKRQSPTRGMKYTDVKNIPGGSGVVSLWDSATGTADLSKWAANGNDGGTGTGQPKLLNNYLYRGVHSTATFGRAFMHIEFLSCFNPTATGQNRANSGIYQQGRYETQVLDSFGLPISNLDMYGALYSVKDPPFNAALPPQVTLQTYDIYFTPRTSGAANDAAGAAYFTVYANGVLVQDSVIVKNTTTAPYITTSLTTKEGIYLQNHGNEVVFNNIWIVPDATPASLPYDKVLAAAGTVSINKFEIKGIKNQTSLNVLGLGDGYDLTGRHVIHKDGSALSVQPLFVPQNQAK